MNQQSNNAVAIQAPRMALPPEVAERYQIDEDGWRALVEAVFPNAKTPGAVLMALAYCERHKLDIFQRVVHIVPMWNGNAQVETVWPGIGLLRVQAHRQPDFAGFDAPEFGPDKEVHFKGKSRGKGNTTYDCEAKVTFPEWGRMTIYKMIGGQRIAMPGPTVYWEEEFSNKATLSGKCPNEMWQKRPRGQFEKVVEAAALRRAFPDAIGHEYAAEEMEGKQLSQERVVEGEFVEVQEARANQEKRAAAKPKPRRDDYRGSGNAGAAKSDAQPMNEGKAEQEEDETAALDGPGVPETAEQWADFIRLFGIRLSRCKSADDVLALRDAQQWRIDKMEPADGAEMLEQISLKIESFDNDEDEDETASDQGSDGDQDADAQADRTSSGDAGASPENRDEGSDTTAGEASTTQGKSE